MTPLSFVRTTLLAGAIALAVPVFAAAPDASMHEVYLAAEAGKFAEAQAMMDQVLKDHPNSAKAHFVEAELLAKQGKFPAADAELKTAERLAPGLPFAKAGAVEKLRTLLASGHAAPRNNANLSQQPPPVSYNSGANNSGNGGNVSHSSGGGTPWGLLLVLGLVLAAFIVMASRFMARRSAQTQAYGPSGGGVSGFAPAGYPPPQPGYGPAQGYGPAAPGGGGMGLGGSGLGGSIVGGLATGAAVGAGIVAGEALMHRFTDSNRDHGNSSGNQRNDIVYDQPAGNDQLRADDMGGSDFGVNDSSSWDDSSGGGGGGGGGGGDTDDWN